MRRGVAIARATVLEVLGEPFAMLVLIASLALATVAPALHYHQFGEPSRMARDAGFSALLLGGAFHAVFGAVKSFRREIESGTFETALAHSVSRTSFFLWKTLGCAISYGVFVSVVSLDLLTVVNGAEIGGRVAAGTGSLVRLWGPSLALALSPVVISIVAAALMNRFMRARFVLSVNLLALALSAVGALYRFDGALALRILPAAALFATPPLVLLSAAAAFSVRFRFNVAATLVTAVALASLPFVGNYCLADALSGGRSVGFGYFAMAMASAIPAAVAFLSLGVLFANGRRMA